MTASIKAASSRPSSRAIAGLVTAAALWAGAGCIGRGVYHCQENKQCGPDNYCEATTGFCSVPDPTCRPSARRYQEHAPDELAGRCVEDACPSNPVIELRAGASHACLVRQLGDVACWGGGASGQLGDGTRTSRSELKPVPGLDANGLGASALHLALGERHTCALLGLTGAAPAAGAPPDTAIRCWGANDAGQLGDGSMTDALGPVLAAPTLTGVIQLAAGAAFTCALVQDVGSPAPAGHVACWGANDAGQLGSTPAPTSAPVQLAPIAVVLPEAGLVKAISAHGRHACAVTTSGLVYCWGENAQGELGDGSTVDRPQPTLVPGVLDATAVATGAAHTCALTAVGEIWCWGANQVGQLGDGTTDGRPWAAPVPTSSDALTLAAGAYHTCATRVDGGVVCWGANQAGQLGEGTTSNIGVPVPANGIQFGAEVAAGDTFSCARRTDGTIGCWGDNRLGQLGTQTSIRRTQPSQEVALADVRSIGAAGDHTCALQRAGNDAAGNPSWAALCWGHNQAGELGDGTRIDRYTPTTLKIPLDAAEIAPGFTHTCLRTTDARVWCWGRGASGQLGTSSAIDLLFPAAVIGVPGASALGAGGAHTCAVVSGQPVCWGAGTDGQLGDGGAADQTRPVATLGFDVPDVVAVRLGAAHSCALRASGQVACWGANDHGQLGYDPGDLPSSASPLPVAAPGAVPVAVVSLAAGDRHTCAAYADGSAACWGAGTDGQLGWSATALIDHGAPSAVRDATGKDLSGVVEIVAGAGHSCARLQPELRADLPGPVVCWGDNADGQLGDGTLVRRPTAVATAGLPDALALAAGRAHTCALRQDRTVICWGSDNAGQLGDGTPLQFSVPQPTRVPCP
ncbi:MAG TPA: RCC1 repeat-containing protein [Polyangia bacterium]